MDHVIKIRVSAEDKAAFVAAAEREGLLLEEWACTHLKRKIEGDAQLRTSASSHLPKRPSVLQKKEQLKKAS